MSKVTFFQECVFNIGLAFCFLLNNALSVFSYVCVLVQVVVNVQPVHLVRSLASTLNPSRQPHR